MLSLTRDTRVKSFCVETFQNLLINHLNWKCSLIIKNTNHVNSTRETPNKNLFVQLFFILFPTPRILLHFSSEADARCFLCRQTKSISRWWTRSISPSNLLHLFSNIRFCCRCWSSSLVRLSRSSAKYLGWFCHELAADCLHNEATQMQPRLPLFFKSQIWSSPGVIQIWNNDRAFDDEHQKR